MAYQHRELNQFQQEELDKMEDIDIFDDEGDILLDLDWQQYSLGRRYVMCGVDWSWLVKALPCLPLVPPEWWYRISRKQRKWFKGGAACLALLLVLVLILTLSLIPWGGRSSESERNDEDDHGSHNIAAIKPVRPDAGCGWLDTVDPTSLIQPIAYRLDIDAKFVDPFVSRGYVEMDFQPLAESRCVAIHKGDKVTINQVVLLGSGEIGVHSHNKTSGVSTIEFPTLIPLAQATIAFKFDVAPTSASQAGLLLLDVDGDIGGQEKVLMTNSGGRHLFPCIDNLNAKAKFMANVTVPAGVTAVSNMPLVPASVASSGDVETFVFDTSPPIVAHALAFAAANVGKVEKKAMLKRKKQVSIGIYGRNRVDDLKPSLDRVATDLSTCEKFLGVPFPLSKIDYFATPFEPQGKENLGLVFVTESGLSQHPNLTDAFHLKRANELIAHETSLVWFAGVVGLDDNNDVFLRESLATYMQYVAGEVSMPGVGGFDRFYAENLLPALSVDDGVESPPLAARNGSIMIDKIIQQNKGASLLRMLRTYFLGGNDSPSILAETKPGKDPIKDGLRSYVKKYKSKNAGVADLWSTLGESTGEPLIDFLDSWTYAPGVPILHVLREGNQVKVKQSPLSGEPCRKGSEWWIPIGFKTKVDPKPQWKVLNECGPIVLTELSGANDSVLVNHEGFGYFRSHYHWDLFPSWFSDNAVAGGDAVVNGMMSPTDFTVLLSDTFAMNEVGKYEIEVFMNMTSHLGSRLDVSWSPWRVALDNLGKIRNLMQSNGTGCVEELSEYVRTNLTDPILTKISAFKVDEKDSMDLRLLRSTVLLAAVEFGDEQRLQTARELFDGDAFIHADLRDVVYRMAVAHGNSSVFDDLFAKAKHETQIHEKHRLLGALMYTTNSTQRRALLDFVVESNELSPCDLAEVVEHSKGTPTNDLFDIGVETLGSVGMAAAELIHHTAQFVTNFDRVAPLRDATLERPNLEHLAANVERMVKLNQGWLETNAPKVCEWLKAQEGANVRP